MSKHTATPWFVGMMPEADVDEVVQTGARSFSMTGGYTGNEEYDRDMGVYAVVDGEPETIANPWKEADARLIALACNHFEEMLDMLKVFAQCGFKREDGKTWAKCSPNDYDLEAVHALLAKIDGGR